MSGIANVTPSSFPFYFVSSRRPPTVNNRGARQRHHFVDDLRPQRARMPPGPLRGLFYGRVYVFMRDYQSDNDPDADNLSKFVWDLLGSKPLGGDGQPAPLGLNGDDSQVRLRTAGIIALSALADDYAAYSVFNLTGVPDWITQRITRFIGAADAAQSYLTYIELDSLRDEMFRFGPRRRP